ncbi:hypothetical protein DSM100685_1284 [Bifidobacterium avesanii]|nr:hypothetical protein DSM100685_1284 [Bifidobacterium avesanii]
MGFLDGLKSLFAGHGSAGAVKIGGPLTVADAKKALSRVVVQQPLLSMRPVAEAMKDLQERTPAFVTYAMDHYFNSPKLVRFQNSGGRQLDVDAIASLHAQPGPLADEVAIQHLLDDIDDRRGHASADAEIGHIDVTPVARKTAEVLNAAADSPEARHWLYALLDQIATIDEVTGGDLAPLADALSPALGTAIEASTAGIRAALVDALGIGSGNDDGLRAALLDPAATTDAYMKAVKILESHGIEVPGSVELA